MNRKKLYMGMGMGLMVGGAAALAASKRRRSTRSMMGRTFKSISQAADSIYRAMG